MANMNFVDYQRAVKWLEGLANLPIADYMSHRHGLRQYIVRTKKLLTAVNRPDKKLRFIHLTGTSGKGTTVAMLQNILTAQGQKVGTFTSPHVTTTIERMAIDDRLISPDDFVLYLNKLKPAIELMAQSRGGRPSYFEILLAMALWYFADQKCDYVILEAGCGGRYDATNVITRPVVTAITHVDLDHQEVLGKTKSKIALDKAGIIKPGSEFFSAETDSKIKKLFQQICRRQNVSSHFIKSPQPNAALALAIADFLGYPTTQAPQAFLACRFETMANKPQIILDGAHNPDKIKTLIKNLADLKYKNCHLIFGAAANKDSRGMLQLLRPMADSLMLTRFSTSSRQAANPVALVKQAIEAGFKTSTVDISLDCWHALDVILQKANKSDLIVVTGSFFLTGELRTKWFDENYILKNRRTAPWPKIS